MSSTITAWLRQRRFALFVALGILTMARTGSGQESPVVVARTAWLMGTQLTVSVTAVSEERGFRLIENAFDSVRSYEALLSTWRVDSELSGVNDAPVGQWVPLSPRLAELLATVRSWRERTDGAFDPAIGALVDAWDLRGDGRVPEPAALARARAAAGLGLLEFSASRHAVRRLAAGAWLDAGAFGKGAALAAAAAALRAGGITSALLDFGGQLVVLGERRRIPVAHPLARDRPAASITLAHGSVATSGQSERFVLSAGRKVGHVLDPRTGEPAPAWGSVTVVHEDPVAADILATALFVMGPEAGHAWADRHGLAALFLIVDANSTGAALDLRCTRAVQPYLLEETACACDSWC